MSVGIFRGKYVIADNAYDYIDVDSIMKGYHELKDAAARMRTTGKDISTISEVLNNSNIYVTGEHFDEYVKNCGDGVSISSDSLNEYADQLLLELHRALDKKQIELNDTAKVRDDELAAQNSEKNRGESYE